MMKSILALSILILVSGCGKKNDRDRRNVKRVDQKTVSTSQTAGNAPNGDSGTQSGVDPKSESSASTKPIEEAPGHSDSPTGTGDSQPNTASSRSNGDSVSASPIITSGKPGVGMAPNSEDQVKVTLPELSQNTKSETTHSAKVEEKKAEQSKNSEILAAKEKQETSKPASIASDNNAAASKDAAKTDLDKLDSAKQAARVNETLDTKVMAVEGKNELLKDPRERAAWDRLLKYLDEKGTKEENQMGQYKSIQEVKKYDEKGSQLINTIALVNNSRVEATWANWKRIEGDLINAEQWMFLLSKSGEISQTWQIHMIRKTNDTVVKHQSLEHTPEQASKKWEELRAEWFKRLEKLEANSDKKE